MCLDTICTGRLTSWGIRLLCLTTHPTPWPWVLLPQSKQCEAPKPKPYCEEYPSTNKADDQFADMLKTLSGSQDNASTSATTSSGILSSSTVQFSCLDKGVILQRECEEGMWYRWRSIASAKTLADTSKFEAERWRVDNFQRSGSKAHNTILDCPDTRIHLAVGALLHVLFLKAFKFPKKNGVSNIIETKKQYPLISLLRWT